MEHLDRKEFATGLGLTLVKVIVGECNGNVWVEDRIKGDQMKGSNFIVTLPKG
jgi:signal transduction histidine kinase